MTIIIRLEPNDLMTAHVASQGANNMEKTGANLDEIGKRLSEAGVHTVEVAVPDNTGHLRGKRMPVDHFLGSVATHGCHLADAIFALDLHDEIVDNPYVNMGEGFLDFHLSPELNTLRVFTHRPGYALVFCGAEGADKKPVPFAPRTELQRQIERLTGLGYEPHVATEMEFFLCDPDWEPVESSIKYSSLTVRPDIEAVVLEMREGLRGAAMRVEQSNLEYGPSQIEINVAASDAMTTADNTVLYKSIIKEVAELNGYRATFMSKPWADQSGCGMHIHSSLNADGVNVFSDSADAPNAIMSHWIAGQVEHAAAMQLLGIPFPTGYKRARPYTFAPTHVTWGLDNRSLLFRCIVGQGNANRVENRAAGADANPHLMLAALLGSGADGIERQLELPGVSSGDTYDDPGTAASLPATADEAITAFEGSALSTMFAEELATSVLVGARWEASLAADNGVDQAADEITQWELERYLRLS